MQHLRQCVSCFLEQTLHLPNLRITKIQANAVSNRHPSFSAGFKVSPLAPSGIDSPTANIQQEAVNGLAAICQANVASLCISLVLCQLLAIWALP